MTMIILYLALSVPSLGALLAWSAGVLAWRSGPPGVRIVVASPEWSQE